MTVAELIAHLATQPLSAKVYFVTPNNKACKIDTICNWSNKRFVQVTLTKGS